MTGEIWYKCECVYCGKVNWIYAGYFPDPDLSKMDIDGFSCWNCLYEQSLMEEVEEGFSSYTAEGKKSPT
jgi:hypothetical protein